MTSVQTISKYSRSPARSLFYELLWVSIPIPFVTKLVLNCRNKKAYICFGYRLFEVLAGGLVRTSSLGQPRMRSR